MNNELEEIKKDYLVELESWAGLSMTPGIQSYIVANDKSLYQYHRYMRKTLFIEEHNIPLEGLSKIGTITDETYNKIIDFINNKIIGKEFEVINMRDGRVSINGRYNGIDFKVSNYIDLYNELKEIILNK